MSKNIIFVGGIHGVGKGTFCKKIVEKFDFIHLSASEVLKWDEISDLTNKRVLNFSTTQDRLINNLNQIVEPIKKYLLDGHFVLLNSKGQPNKIEEATFFKINPYSIFLLICEPKTIFERLNERDNSKYDLDILIKMQEMEIEHATYISEKLKIPLFILKDGETDPIHEYLQNYENIN